LSDPAKFIFVVCQRGAEAAVKQELAINHPCLHLSFSRPGFLTFKVEERLPERFHLKSTFARTFGWSTGKATNADARPLIDELLRRLEQTKSGRLHLWQRDTDLPGSHGFEPGSGALIEALSEAIMNEAELRQLPIQINRTARPDELLFDTIVVEPNQWWFGYHWATHVPGRWPGGVPTFTVNPMAISRAYHKIYEATLWAGIRIRRDDVCAEIGSSPGGVCQWLLEKGARVIAIDPAELDPEVAGHANLIHFRCRGREVRKRALSEARWLFADINAAPEYTLDTIEGIVTNRHVRRVAGLVLTLKISDFKNASAIPDWIGRVRNWGFPDVKTRQLAFNRQEICLAATRHRAKLRALK
jgi:23S rRNA (cytidine2498-2'-O)-methyltransferase